MLAAADAATWPHGAGARGAESGGAGGGRQHGRRGRCVLYHKRIASCVFVPATMAAQSVRCCTVLHEIENALCANAVLMQLVRRPQLDRYKCLLYKIALTPERLRAGGAFQC